MMRNYYGFIITVKLKKYKIKSIILNYYIND